MNKSSDSIQTSSIPLPDWVMTNLGVDSGHLLEFKQQGEEIVVRRKARDILALVARYSHHSEFAPQNELEFLEQSRAERGWDKEDALAFERWEKSQ